MYREIFNLFNFPPGNEIYFFFNLQQSRFNRRLGEEEEETSSGS